MSPIERPNWEPLIDLVGLELVRWFMWMGQVELIDDTLVHAYKHVATRRYLHVGEDGRLFAYRSPETLRRDRSRAGDRGGVLGVGAGGPGAGRRRAPRVGGAAAAGGDVTGCATPSAKEACVQFMVIERFRSGARPVYERFASEGRLMPEGSSSSRAG